MCTMASESGKTFSVPQMKSARWVKAELLPGWGLYNAWLVNECVHGYWVQFDCDSPYRLVDRIEEIDVKSAV